MKIIDSFEGKYSFLSNFYPSKIKTAGYIFPTVEHYFQAHKVPLNSPASIAIRQASTPGEAKRLGRKYKIHTDWDNVKVQIMMDGLRLKFYQSRFTEKLLSTKSHILIEGNTWGDTFWGQVDGQGINMLGTLLMIVRKELGGGW